MKAMAMLLNITPGIAPFMFRIHSASAAATVAARGAMNRSGAASRAPTTKTERGDVTAIGAVGMA